MDEWDITMIIRNEKGQFVKGMTFKMSEEIKIKIGISNKGRKKKGKDLERVRKQLKELAQKRIGTHLSDDTKKKIGEKNKIHMQEKWDNGTAYKIFNFRKGRTSLLKGKTHKEMYGIKRAEEIRKKISISRIGRIPINKGKSIEELYGEERAKELREINIKAHKGKKHTEEWKKNARERLKLYNPNIGKKFPKELYPNKGLRKTRKNIIMPIKDSSIEVKIQNFLKQLGISFFTHQHIKEIEHGYQCDILIPSMNLVIECDGDCWHKYPIGNDIDHIRTKELIEKGFKVLRLWEFEIRVMDIDNFKSRLTQFYMPFWRDY